jgi:hypothetical protein
LHRKEKGNIFLEIKPLSMKFSLPWLLIVFSFLAACTQLQGDKETSSAKLLSFKGFPAGIEGCSCYFSMSEKDFRNDEYIFISDFDSTAYISVNGKPLTLRLIETTRLASTPDERGYRETYSNGTYSLIIKVAHKENIADEVWWNTGEVILLFKGTQTYASSFIGECGC